jgi:ATP-dependent DNA helicase RecG
MTARKQLFIRSVQKELADGRRALKEYVHKVVRILLGDQSIEYTIPDKPNSCMPRYRLTAKGRAVVAAS